MTLCGDAQRGHQISGGGALGGFITPLPTLPLRTELPVTPPALRVTTWRERGGVTVNQRTTTTCAAA